MADFDRITVDGVTKNVKDSTARTAEGTAYDNEGSGVEETTVQAIIDSLITLINNAGAALLNKLDKNDPTGTGKFAVGENVTATGTAAHAEGRYTTASGVGSHAEGYLSDASGQYGHAENNGCSADGNYSHAEGEYTTATGKGSHAEGLYTEAGSDYQHVSGKWNIVDTSDTYAEIIGNGTDQNNLSNARTLDWSGNETIAGDFFFNGNVTGLTAQLAAKANSADVPPGPTDYQSASLPAVTGTDYGSYQSGGYVSLSNTTYKSVGTVNLTAGTWIVEVAVRFAANATGIRFFGVSTSKNASSWGSTDETIIDAVQTNATTGGNSTFISHTYLLNCTATTRFHIVGYQNSGSALNVYPRVRYIKIRSL